ncbi:hypothetical protein BHE74_00012511 [Ensete ventricosum]|nr:hypothetical protein BHE74_00012511 [Ensete ventricosum]
MKQRVRGGHPIPNCTTARAVDKSGDPIRSDLAETRGTPSLFDGAAAMAAFKGVRDATSTGAGGVAASVAMAAGGSPDAALNFGDGAILPHSPAKVKAAPRGRASSWSSLLLLLGRTRKIAKVRLVLAAGVLLTLVLLSSQVGPLMGWNHQPSSSASSPSRYSLSVSKSSPSIEVLTVITFLHWFCIFICLLIYGLCRNCEDIAMSLLVANVTQAPPIWVKGDVAFVAGKIHEIGSNGISSLAGHNKRRNNCLNAFISLYGAVPLVSTNIKAVDAREEWFW